MSIADVIARLAEIHERMEAEGHGDLRAYDEIGTLIAELLGEVPPTIAKV